MNDTAEPEREFGDDGSSNGGADQKRLVAAPLSPQEHRPRIESPHLLGCCACFPPNWAFVPVWLQLSIWWLLLCRTVQPLVSYPLDYRVLDRRIDHHGLEILGLITTWSNPTNMEISFSYSHIQSCYFLIL